MFGINSNEALPPAINTDYAAWDHYMAHLWYHLLYFFNLKSDATIIEVAPGSSNKLSLALSKIPFAGNFYIVEPHAKLAEIAYDQYKKLLPNANIILLKDTLENALDRLPKSPDALISNHPLDDMLLAVDTAANNSLFDWACDTPTSNIDFTSEKWLQLTADPEKIKHSCKQVFDTWDTTLEMLQPDLLILSQYPSFTLEHANLTELNHVSLAILEKLRQKYIAESYPTAIIQTLLNGMKNYNHPHIGYNILDATNWLILKTGRNSSL